VERETMTTLERLKKILVERYNVEPEQVTPDKPIQALGLDSLGMTELLFFIEEEFEITLPYEPTTLRTVEDAVRYIDEVLASQRPGAPLPAPEVSMRPSHERPA
jgi:acyl carrier protein